MKIKLLAISALVLLTNAATKEEKKAAKKAAKKAEKDGRQSEIDGSEISESEGVDFYDLANWGLNNEDFYLTPSTDMNRWSEDVFLSMVFGQTPFQDLMHKDGYPVGAGMILDNFGVAAGHWMVDDSWAMGAATPMGEWRMEWDGRVFEEMINFPGMLESNTKYESYTMITSEREICVKEKNGKCKETEKQKDTELAVGVEGSMTYEIEHSMKCMDGETSMKWQFVEGVTVKSMPETISRKKRDGHEDDKKNKNKNKKNKKNKKDKEDKKEPKPEPETEPEPEPEQQRMLHNLEGIEFQPDYFTETFMMKSSPAHFDFAVAFDMVVPIEMYSENTGKMITCIKIDQAPYSGNEDNFELLEEGSIGPHDFNDHWGFAIEHTFELSEMEMDTTADTASMKMFMQNLYGDSWKKNLMKPGNIKNPVTQFQMDMQMDVSGFSSCDKAMKVMHFYMYKMMMSMMETPEEDHHTEGDHEEDHHEEDMDEFYMQLMGMNDTDIMAMVAGLSNCEITINMNNMIIDGMTEITSFSMKDVFNFAEQTYTYTQELNGEPQVMLTQTNDETDIQFSFDMFTGEENGMEHLMTINHNKLMKLPYTVMKMGMSEYLLMEMHWDMMMNWNQTHETPQIGAHNQTEKTEQNWALLLAGIINQDHFQNQQYEEVAQMIEAWGTQYCPMNWRDAFATCGITIPANGSLDYWHYASMGESLAAMGTPVTELASTEAIDAASVTYCNVMVSTAAESVRGAKNNYMDVVRTEISNMAPMVRQLITVMEDASSPDWKTNEFEDIKTFMQQARNYADCEFAIDWTLHHPGQNFEDLTGADLQKCNSVQLEALMAEV